MQGEFALNHVLPMCLPTGTAMAFGFAMRIVLAGAATSLGIYIIEDLFILLSPCFFLANNYVILSRLAVSLSTPASPVSTTCLLLPAQRIAKIFVWSDVITFWIQASGGGLSASNGLAVVGQKYPEVWHMGKTGGRREWRILFYTVCITCIGILVRSAFRIAEFSEGYTGYIPTHEAYFYCLDSIPLLLAISFYMFVWPPVYTHQEVESKDIEVPDNGGYPMAPQPGTGRYPNRA
ncbi:hypothetical protein HWV62_38080 [Athelia sp. TMB]|nr:hypothetical protein HWV62_38080 [Athelia sp. TMB]